MKIPPPLPLIAGYSVNKTANAIKKAEDEYIKTLTEDERKERERLMNNQRVHLSRSLYGVGGVAVLGAALMVASGPFAFALGLGAAVLAWRSIKNAKKLEKDSESLNSLTDKINKRRAAQKIQQPLPLGKGIGM